MRKILIYKLRIDNPNLYIPSNYGLNIICNHHVLDENVNGIYTDITWD